jgi:1-acyl-sn-glycerol-3-phosphate acyltransferase
VIPVAMIDTDKMQPPGQVIPNIRRIGVRIGRPLDFSRYQGMQSDRFVLRSMTDEIMYELMLLSGQEYVDVYAAKAKADIAAAKKAAANQHVGVTPEPPDVSSPPAA